MRRIIAAVFCILMLMSPCSFAQSISDCKSRSFHGCTAGVNNFPLPNGAWVDYFIPPAKRRRRILTSIQLLMTQAAFSFGSNV